MTKFDTIFKHIMVEEGGYVDHPNDPGGATKYGVSLRFLQDVRNRFIEKYIRIFGTTEEPTKGLVRELTLEQARRCFYHFFWVPLNLDGQPLDIARETADFAFNASVRQAAKNLQRAINRVILKVGATESRLTVKVDGAIGPRTIAAMDGILAEYGDDLLLAFFEAERMKFYRLIFQRRPDKFHSFIKGWLRRAKTTDTRDLPDYIEGDTDV